MSTTARESFDCPSCSRTFDTKKGRSVHHQSTHGESIAKTTKECVVCGDNFTTYFDNQKACSNACKGSLISECKSEGLTEKCEDCGSTVDVQGWEREWKDMFFCDMSCKASWQKERPPEEHPSWKGGYRLRGPNWREKRDKVLQRDGRKCRVCGKTSDDVENHGLHVHHIVKLRKFDQIEDANMMDNLITLCPTHHTEVESGDRQCPEPGDTDE